MKSATALSIVTSNDDYVSLLSQLSMLVNPEMQGIEIYYDYYERDDKDYDNANYYNNYKTNAVNAQPIKLRITVKKPNIKDPKRDLTSRKRENFLLAKKESRQNNFNKKRQSRSGSFGGKKRTRKNKI